MPSRALTFWKTRLAASSVSGGTLLGSADLPLLEIAVPLALEHRGEPVDDVRDLLLLGVKAQIDAAVGLLYRR
jgi:hypothetical protein